MQFEELRWQLSSHGRQCPSGLLDFFCELLLIRQGEFVLTGEDLVPEIAERVVGHSIVLFRAEDQADRRVLIGEGPVLASIGEVKIHLSGIGVAEAPDFEVDDDQTAKPAVKEEQVNALPFVSDPEPPLAADEGELVPEFEQEVLQVPNEYPPPGRSPSTRP